MPLVLSIAKMLNSTKCYCDRYITGICLHLSNVVLNNFYISISIEPSMSRDTDEERLFGVTEEEEVDESVASRPEYQQWEEFATVATNLLEKIEKYLESLQAFSGSENTTIPDHCVAAS